MFDYELYTERPSQTIHANTFNAEFVAKECEREREKESESSSTTSSSLNQFQHNSHCDWMEATIMLLFTRANVIFPAFVCLGFQI